MFEPPETPPEEEWCPTGEPGLSLWPPEGAPTPDGGWVACASDHAGRRHLVHAVPGRPGTVAWRALSTDRPRDLSGLSGETEPGTAAEVVGHALRSGQAGTDGRSVAAAFLAAYPSWTGEAASVRDGFLSTCGRACPHMLALGEPMDWLRTVDRLAGMPAVDAALERLPLLAPVLKALTYRMREQWVRDLALPLLDPATTLDGLCAALRAADTKGRIAPRPLVGDHSLRALARNMRGTWLPLQVADAAMTLAPLAPADWMPRDAEGARSMAFCVGLASAAARKSRGVLSVEELLAPARGDWGRLRLSLVGVGGGPEVFAESLRDMAAALDEEVVRPAEAHAAPGAGLPLPGHGRERRPETAWRVLFAGKGLPAVARALDDWHGRGHGITRAVRSLQPVGALRWPRMVRNHACPDGASVVELSTFEALHREGGALSHCVATFAQGCAEGEFAILSVRDPSGRPTSTAQVSPGWEVLQHKAGRNADPSPADAELLAACLAGARPGPALRASRRVEGALLRLLAWLRRRANGSWAGSYPYDPRDRGHLDAAASLWARYLPRPSRDPAVLAAGGRAAVTGGEAA